MSAELIARLEAASEGSRELDSEIYLATTKELTAEQHIAAFVEEHGREPGEAFKAMLRDGEAHAIATPPRYTTALDAALTLVPEGCSSWELDWSGHSGMILGKPYCATIYFKGSSQQHNGDASTAALAVCIAALKARAKGGE